MDSWIKPFPRHSNNKTLSNEILLKKTFAYIFLCYKQVVIVIMMKSTTLAEVFLTNFSGDFFL